MRPCHWCGSWDRVKDVRRNGEPIPHQVDGRSEPLRLCFRCFGHLRETGERRPGVIVPVDPAGMEAIAKVARR